EEAEILEGDRLGEKRVRPDRDIDFAGRDRGLVEGRLLGRNEPRQRRDANREAVETLPERLGVLPREKGRRHDDRDLLAAGDGREGGAESDFRLAEADIAADEPIHGAARSEILQDGFYGGVLVLGFFVGEAGGELVGEAGRCGKWRGGAGRPHGGKP